VTRYKQEETEDLQSPAIEPYPELDDSVHIVTFWFWKIQFNIILSSTCSFLEVSRPKFCIYFSWRIKLFLEQSGGYQSLVFGVEALLL
jgi:hypothetical protein